MDGSEPKAVSASFRKRAEAERIRRLADHMPAILAAQVRRDAAVLEIEADGLDGRARGHDS